MSIAGVYSQLKLRKVQPTTTKKPCIDAAYTRDFKLPYSVQLAGLGQFDKALAAVNELLATNPANPNTVKACNLRKRCYEFMVDYARQHPDSGYVFAPQNLGSMINSPESNTFLLLSIDGKELVFHRRVGEMNEDFYYSRLQASGEWSQAKPMEGDEYAMNEAAQNIRRTRTDGIYRQRPKPTATGILTLHRLQTPMGWSDASNPGGRVNSDQWDSQPCLRQTKDSDFASRRQGGYGGSDIYVCHLQPNGKWGGTGKPRPGRSIHRKMTSAPLSMPTTRPCFYLPTGRVMGDETFSMFVKMPMENGVSWSTWDIRSIPSTGRNAVHRCDGKTAFYASDRADSKGGIDLYRFILRKDIRSRPHALGEGRYLTTNQTGTPSS